MSRNTPQPGNGHKLRKSGFACFRVNFYMIRCGRDVGDIIKVWLSKNSGVNDWGPHWVKVENGGKVKHFHCGFGLGRKNKKSCR